MFNVGDDDADGMHRIIFCFFKVRLDDECRPMSQREEESENNHGLSLKNIVENQQIEHQEDATEVSLPKSDLSDHSLGFIQEKHTLLDVRATGVNGYQGRW